MKQDFVTGPEFVTGNVVRGNDLWDRDEEFEEIIRVLKKDSVLVKAPRRYGKTSLMNKVHEHFKAEQTSFLIDVEGLESPEGFISKVLAAVLEEMPSDKRSTFAQLTGRLGELLAGIDEFEVANFRVRLKEAIKDDWQEQGKALFELLIELETPVLIIIDEFPVLLDNMSNQPETARIFLQWFRNIRLNSNLQNVRWVLAGSLAIEVAIKRVDAEYKIINDLSIVAIGPFSDSVAIDFIKALIATDGSLEQIGDDCARFVLEKIGSGVPYFIQVLLKESRNLALKEGAKAITKEIVQRAYDDSVLGPTHRTYFAYYYARLSRDLDAKQVTVAKEIVLAIAREERMPKEEVQKLLNAYSKGELKNEDFNTIMTYIEDEFYVEYVSSERIYRFSTNLLRDWWLRYYDFI